ncbi:MAG: DNA-directed RNA polymerase subunit E'' [Candidatus Aenigmarchaeota archaeon]|nr:DNA-directed RNA polymerase subunit E'' [Candidatus Aenigmarchaeota archaeon]
MLKACIICKRLTEKKECEVCKNKDLSDEWSGIVVILNPKESKVSQILNIETQGMYAQNIKTL